MDFRRAYAGSSGGLGRRRLTGSVRQRSG